MASHSDSTSAFLQGGDMNFLYGAVDRYNVHGLNLREPESAKDLIKPWDERDDTSKYADSGVDDQMIIHVPFVQAVRLKAILLKLSRGDSAPRRLRVYANRPTIVDFSDAEDIRPHLDIRLLVGEADVTEYPLRTAAFANVNSLSIFLDDSEGGELSRAYFIGFKGDTREPSKEATDKLDVPAANAADAPLFDRLAERSGASQTTAR